MLKIGDRVFDCWKALPGTITKIEDFGGQKHYWVKPDAPQTHVFTEDELTELPKCKICEEELTVLEADKTDGLCDDCTRKEREEEEENARSLYETNRSNALWLQQQQNRKQ